MFDFVSHEMKHLHRCTHKVSLLGLTKTNELVKYLIARVPVTSESYDERKLSDASTAVEKLNQCAERITFQIAGYLIIHDRIENQSESKY